MAELKDYLVAENDEAIPPDIQRLWARQGVPPGSPPAAVRR
jgi:hypothetical protein